MRTTTMIPRHPSLMEREKISGRLSKEITRDAGMERWQDAPSGVSVMTALPLVRLCPGGPVCRRIGTERMAGH
jgi:hypothetical protein